MAVKVAGGVIRELAQADLEALGKDELLVLLERLDDTSRLLAASRVRVLSAVDSTEAWRGQGGDVSVAGWRSRTTRSGQGKALRDVNVARTLAGTPGASEALIAGDMTPEHAEALSRVATGGGAERRSKIAEALADPELSGDLIESAKHLDAPRFARAAESWAARLDPMTLEADHEEQRRARFLMVADTPGGTVLKGRLDKMAGHRLRMALEAVTPVPSAEDSRDPRQRAADALDTLAQGALADPTSKPGGHVPPQVSIIMTEQTLAGLRVLADPSRHGDALEFDPATLEDGTPVPVSETARILCDAQVTRIVVDAESVPIDLGRTKRLWTGPQRRAVIARDRHCAFAGCQVPARWCEIHHIEWWARDRGTTDIENAVLLCSGHHGVVHANNLKIMRDPAPPGVPGVGLPLVGYTITDPAGRQWSTRTNGPPRISSSQGDGGRPWGAPPPVGSAPPTLVRPCDNAMARPTSRVGPSHINPADKPANAKRADKPANANEVDESASANSRRVIANREVSASATESLRDIGRDALF